MQQVQVIPFLQVGATIAVSVTASSSSTAITPPNSPKNPALPGTVRVVNAGADLVFVSFSVASVAATSADLPVPSGNTEVFWTPAGIAYANVIAASASATVYFTPGQGS
jgi:hypothetical protein